MKITKRQLRRIIKEAISDGPEIPDVLGAMGDGKFQPREESDFDRIIVGWDSDVNRHGHTKWFKRHKTRSAHVISDPSGSKWEWSVFEFKYSGNTDDEDIIEDGIAQGTETSLRSAILAADKILLAGR